MIDQFNVPYMFFLPRSQVVLGNAFAGEVGLRQTDAPRSLLFRGGRVNSDE